jgi:hypothetical protein
MDEMYLRGLNIRLYDIFRQFASAMNLGLMWKGEGTAAPTTGTWAQSDMVRNTAPSEAGAASSKYVVIGWIAISSGTPGTWKEMRCLTGN